MKTAFDFSFFPFQNQNQKSDYGSFSRFFHSAPPNGKWKMKHSKFRLTKSWRRWLSGKPIASHISNHLPRSNSISLHSLSVRIPSSTIIMAGLEEHRELIEQMFRSGKTHSEMSETLRSMGVKGSSEMSVRRFCGEVGLRRKGHVTDQELEEAVISSIQKVSRPSLSLVMCLNIIVRDV